VKPEDKSALRGLLASALVPALLAGIFSPILGLSVFVVSFVLASLVGYPIFLLFKRYSLLANGWVASLIGALVGFGLATYIFRPSSHPDLKGTSWRSSGEDRIYTAIDGVPTQAAWDDYYLACGILAIIGALTGLVFWLYGTKPHDQSTEAVNDK
jgi:hypothetical protein